MKKLLALFLVALAACYYMGYSPVDFIPSFQASSPPPPKARRQAPAEPAPNAAPVQRTGGSTVIAGSSNDGSLEHRWKP